MDNPLISVIIPTFNRANSLANAMRSVFHQDYSELELIIVDDDSDDGTDDLLSAMNDPRLSYFKINRSGVSRARNIGVEKSRGQFIAFLDSDDIWHNDKLKKQVAFHRANPNLFISQTREIWIRNNKRVNPKTKHTKPEGYIFPESLNLCTITPSSVYMKKELFLAHGGFDEKMPACEDYDLWLRITAKHNVGLLKENLLTKFGGHEDQLSQTYSAMDRFRIYSLGKALLSDMLSDQQKKQTLAAFNRKVMILLAGIRKRHPHHKELLSFVEQLPDLTLSPAEFCRQSEQFLLSDTYFE